MSESELPEGWIRAGSNPADYEMRVDRSQSHSGSASALLASRVEQPTGFGTLMQCFVGSAFHGKRVRMTAFVRSEDVAGWAGLWLRVDNEQTSSAFDNMGDRAIHGTKEWTRHAIVLDVAEDTASISFGLLLSGTGRTWVDDFEFEVVGADVPVTGTASCAPDEPRNLDFEAS